MSWRDMVGVWIPWTKASPRQWLIGMGGFTALLLAFCLIFSWL